MSEASRLSDTDDSVGQENYISSSSRDSSPFRDTSSLLGEAIPHLEPAPLDAFPLMRLSPELRLNVYDQLLTDLTVNRQRAVADLSRYHRAHEWPKNDFSAYLSLLLTCKEVHCHVKGLWENVYIHKCCFYFWKLPSFHRVATSLVKLCEPYQSARYALRTRASDEIGLEEAEFITEEGEMFMKDQPGFPRDNPDYTDFQWSWPQIPYASRSGTHTLDGNGPIPVETYRQGPKRSKYARASFPGLTGCSLVVHDRQVSESHAGTAYMLMSGAIGNVYWGKYDAAFGHGKQMIWDEWERRGFPDTSLTRADTILSQKTQLETCMAAVWARKGDEPRDHEFAVFIIEDVYCLGNWLRLRPSYAVG
ncbi:hypothetical protein MBLNU13_g09907t1 [Cladosporium sp. NU13]